TFYFLFCLYRPLPELVQSPVLEADLRGCDPLPRPPLGLPVREISEIPRQVLVVDVDGSCRIGVLLQPLDQQIDRVTVLPDGRVLQPFRPAVPVEVVG